MGYIWTLFSSESPDVYTVYIDGTDDAHILADTVAELMIAHGVQAQRDAVSNDLLSNAASDAGLVAFIRTYRAEMTEDVERAIMSDIAYGHRMEWSTGRVDYVAEPNVYTF